MATTSLKIDLICRRWLMRRGVEMLRLLMVAVTLIFASGSGSILVADPGGQVSTEEMDEEFSDEIPLTTGEQRTLRRTPRVSGPFVAVSKRGNLTLETAVRGRAGHVFTNGLRAPLRC